MCMLSQTDRFVSCIGLFLLNKSLIHPSWPWFDRCIHLVAIYCTIAIEFSSFSGRNEIMMMRQIRKSSRNEMIPQKVVISQCFNRKMDIFSGNLRVTHVRWSIERSTVIWTGMWAKLLYISSLYKGWIPDSVFPRASTDFRQIWQANRGPCKYYLGKEPWNSIHFWRTLPRPCFNLQTHIQFSHSHGFKLGKSLKDYLFQSFKMSADRLENRNEAMQSPFSKIETLRRISEFSVSLPINRPLWTHTAAVRNQTHPIKKLIMESMEFSSHEKLVTIIHCISLSADQIRERHECPDCFWTFSRASNMGFGTMHSRECVMLLVWPKL
jgi:hypothetical protein